MFVKVQDANDLVNLDRVAEIRMKEEQGKYIIEAIYQDSTHFLLASYKSKTGADFWCVGCSLECAGYRFVYRDHAHSFYIGRSLWTNHNDFARTALFEDGCQPSELQHVTG